MTDIVERLRAIVCDDPVDIRLIVEAADEIERLRSDLEDARLMIQEWNAKADRRADVIARLRKENEELYGERHLFVRRIAQLRDELSGEREQYENTVQQVKDLARERNLLKELLQSAERECEGLRAENEVGKS